MKKFLYNLAISIFAILFFASCNPKQQQVNDYKYEIDTIAIIQRGDSIANAVQQVLLANVLQVSKSGGTVYAVTFCNERAMSLTDSLSQKYNCLIERISQKYRNPANKPGESDEAVLLKMSSLASAEPFLLSGNGIVTYYKPIRIAMPACLNCHGIEGKDISIPTLEAIRQKYPNDLATGYKEGDFRGLWKITFPEE
ncbi:MAG: DUF3365 domain-containing protein [Lentimicrobium sp.]|nr:DUF3365 domain-containing protein [Lentimicrobium sp.]